MSIKKSNLVILHIYTGKDEFVTVLYKPYLNVILKTLFKDTTNYFSTENWRTMLDLNGIYDSHVCMNYDALKEEFQYAYKNHYIKDQIKSIISELKNSEKHLQQAYESKNNDFITLQSMIKHEKPTPIVDYMYEGTLTKDKYKRFIIYLMKEYKVNKELAYSFYKEGLTNKEFAFSFDKIFDNANAILKRFYKSTKDVHALDREVFTGFWEYLSNKTKIKEL